MKSSNSSIIGYISLIWSEGQPLDPGRSIQPYCVESRKDSFLRCSNSERFSEVIIIGATQRWALKVSLANILVAELV